MIKVLEFLFAAAAHAPLVAQPTVSSAAPAASASGPTAGHANPTVAITASGVIDKVQKFYKDIQRVTAVFRQTAHITTFGTSKTSEGTLWLMKPGKMRWDYVEKKNDVVRVKKSFISNGTNLYIVEHDNKQVLKKNLQQDLMPVAVSFLYGKGDLKQEFNAELDATTGYGTQSDIVVKLTPKKPSAQYKHLILVVDPTQFRVKQSVIVDTSNNTNHFQFFSPDFEKPIKDSWFEFHETSVKNYRIIDGDAPATSGSAARTP